MREPTFSHANLLSYALLVAVLVGVVGGLRGLGMQLEAMYLHDPVQRPVRVAELR